ncbi:MAG: hypothetical protein ACI30C_08055 [Muribaculaceae bacterium]
MKSVEDVMNKWNALQPLSDRDRDMLSRRFTIDFNYNPATGGGCRYQSYSS